MVCQLPTDGVNWLEMPVTVQLPETPAAPPTRRLFKHVDWWPCLKHRSWSTNQFMPRHFRGLAVTPCKTSFKASRHNRSPSAAWKSPEWLTRAIANCCDISNLHHSLSLSLSLSRSKWPGCFHGYPGPCLEDWIVDIVADIYLTKRWFGKCDKSIDVMCCFPSKYTTI